MEFDFIIVGGGSAGCVMANRLSARSANRVLVLEAGPDTPHGKVPAEILDSYPGTAYFDQRFHWTQLKVYTQPIPHNDPTNRPPLRKYEQARVLGGGSSINGQLANRGAPYNYDEWESMGAEGWGPSSASANATWTSKVHTTATKAGFRSAASFRTSGLPMPMPRRRPSSNRAMPIIPT